MITIIIIILQANMYRSPINYFTSYIRIKFTNCIAIIWDVNYFVDNMLSYLRQSRFSQ